MFLDSLKKHAEAWTPNGFRKNNVLCVFETEMHE